jgi:hypothetical protein
LEAEYRGAQFQALAVRVANRRERAHRGEMLRRQPGPGTAGPHVDEAHRRAGQRR